MQQWEHIWLMLEWHSGLMGMGSGWDQQGIALIHKAGEDGFEMVGITGGPTRFLLFFKRPKPEAEGQ